MAEPAYRAINDGSRVGAHQTATASSSRLVDVDLLEQVVPLGDPGAQSDVVKGLLSAVLLRQVGATSACPPAHTRG
ncbi:MAG: hypothetical protein AABM41_08835 [Chloroflexota bacterium]